MKAAYTKPFVIIAVILVADQLIKTWVRTHIAMDYGEVHFLGNKGMLKYTLNNGMAFGWEIGGEGGKLTLSIFRVLAVAAIGWGLVYLISHKYHRGLIICVTLIFAGALGNIIDCTFYGLLYQHGKLFEGKVVDMFYFPLVDGTWPSWVPLLHDRPLRFFEPIFNLADASISVGVIAILIFQKRYFKKEHPEPTALNSEMVEE